MQQKMTAVLATLIISIGGGYTSTVSAQELKAAFESDATYKELVLLQENLELRARSTDAIVNRAGDRSDAAVRVDPRIVGGVSARIEDVPWQVALIRGSVDEPERSQFCGGSIVGDRWIVTAAHCVDVWFVRRNPKNLHVVAGTALYRSGGQRASVAEIIVHPSYGNSANGHNMDHDVALLRLNEELTVGKPIALPEPGTHLEPGIKSIVVGWGAIFEGGPGSEELLGASIPIVSRATCNKPESYNGRITEFMFCAGEREGGIDACQGDSGGPKFVEINGSVVLIGVVSFGEGCARRLKYGVYTDLTHSNHLDFINNTVAEK